MKKTGEPIAGPREVTKRVIKHFEEAYRQNYSWSSFQDGVELILCALTRFEPGKEDRYMEIVRKNGDEFPRIIARIYAELTGHFYMNEQFDGILGSAYMELSWNKKPAGQFFTPWNVALMMAQMNLPEELPDDPPLIKVQDPCCGSGIMFLAYKAAVTQKFGRKALRRFWFYGQDIDITCVMMTKIQLLMTNQFYMKWLLLGTASEIAMEQGRKAPAQEPKAIPATVEVRQDEGAGREEFQQEESGQLLLLSEKEV